MKKTTLTTLILLFCIINVKSQEAILAIKLNGVWVQQNNYPQLVNSLLPGTSVLHFDSSYVETVETSIQIVGHTTDSNRLIADRIVGYIQGNYMYTIFDAYPANYYLECTSTDCCLCKKNVMGKCYCYADYCTKSKCEERTYGTTDIPAGGISNRIRQHLL
jgi:hypothetical protein